MPNYDFKVLSPIDFEAFTRDLLQKELRTRLETFKPGPDQGIDLRCARNRSQHLIVQCKHYAGSTFAALIRDLRSECRKVYRLQPKRYVLSTSLGLSPRNKEHILNLFQPCLRSPADIFGRDDLNNLLGRHKEVERQTFKLWFASTTVFEEILNRKVTHVSRDALESIREKAKSFVQNPSFGTALKILKKHNFCVIAGIPGIGKTTLAEMLLLHFIELGYELVKIESDISEARGLDYVNQKRIFYYDDFLGQASLSEKLNKNEDQKLLDFLNAIQRSGISKMILTTREYILNQTRLHYEKMARSRFDVQTCVIDLQQYTRLIRAQILFNHLYFSKLGHRHKKALLRDRRYLRIIDHRSYNPRIIEFMTDPTRVAGVSPQKFVALFLNSLENPLEIWRHLFEEQLSDGARVLLIILATLPKDVFLDDVRSAFDSLYGVFTDLYNFQTHPNDFLRVLRELDGNFVSFSRDERETTISFHNPSIRDFVQHYLLGHDGDVLALLQGVVFFEQLSWLWNFENRTGQNFRITLRRHAGSFVSALRRTVDRPSYKQRYRWVKDEWRFDSISIEERSEVLISIARTFQNRDLLTLIEEQLERVRKRMRRRASNRKDVARLLNQLAGLPRFATDQRKNLIASAKQFFLHLSGNIAEFEAYREFVRGHSRVFTKAERFYAEQEFKKLCDEEVYDDDPDSLRQYASQLEDLASLFDVDVTYKLQVIEDLATAHEEEARRKSPEKKELDAPEPTKANCTDGEIASMFDVFR